MFFCEERLQARIKELDPWRYREVSPIEHFKAHIGAPSTKIPQESHTWEDSQIGDKWIGRDLTVWLKTTITIPANWEGKKPLLFIDFGDTGSCHNFGFESLLYIDGVPYQGVDSNHKEVFLPPNFIGREVELYFKLWSGLEGGGLPQEQLIQLRRAELAWLDEAVEDLYYSAKAIQQTVALLEDNDPQRHDLLHLLDRSFRLIDWSYPGNAEFYTSLQEANGLLKKQLAQLFKDHKVTVHCLGHTHIDVAWLWRLQHTREKVVRSFSTVLRLMELYPEYIFFQSQPQLYEFIKQDYPELYSQIKERIAEGRWEPGGAMWVEADCNLTSGESLVRQILFGTRFFAQEFGAECKTLWLPDVFGYSWALPQILKKSGITSFITTKISWNQYNRMPHDTFIWRGIDGSEVLTHFITTPEPGRTVYSYNGQVNPEIVTGVWNQYKNKAINKDLLLSYGYGDGGGGVNREMLENRRHLDPIPALPNVQPTRLDNYVDHLHTNIANTDQYVHTWDGELYLEYHRGTYTSQGAIKKANRKLEILLKQAEMLMSLGVITDQSWLRYDQDGVNRVWKAVLQNQFHDILPGSSIREVNEDALRDYAQAEERVKSIISEAVKTENEDNLYSVFNSSSFPQDLLVEMERPEGCKEKGKWFLGDTLLTSEKLGNKWLVQVPSVPSIGWVTIQFKPEESVSVPELTPFVVDGRSIQTPFYDLTISKQGFISKLYDRKNERQILAPGAMGNVLQCFEDKPLRFDAWDIDIFYGDNCEEINSLQSYDVIENNSLRLVIRLQWNYRSSAITQEMILYSSSPRIDFQNSVNWEEKQKLLKVAFPIQIRATEATYDIQFGNVKRPTHWNTSWDYARFEVLGHQWADLSQRDYGVSLLNDCKYGYDIKDNVLRLTLIKSAIYPDYTADRCEHTFLYSILPHKGDWVEGQTVPEASAINEGACVFPGMIGNDQTGSLITPSRLDIVVDAVKKSEDEDSIIIRFHEFKGTGGPIVLQLGLKYSSWCETDLLERPITEENNSEVRLEMGPYEVKTIRVRI